MVIILLLHTPPATASVKVVVVPTHISKMLVIGLGGGAAVTVVVIVQPVAAEVKVITDVPEIAPDSTPELRSIVATPVVALVQVPPPAAASVKAMVDPIQTMFEPVMGGGWFTVTVAVANPATIL
jgi:hypothetical protein